MSGHWAWAYPSRSGAQGLPLCPWECRKSGSVAWERDPAPHLHCGQVSLGQTAGLPEYRFCLFFTPQPPLIDMRNQRLGSCPSIMSQNWPYVCFFGESGKEPVYLLHQTRDSILYPKGNAVGSREGALISFCIWPWGSRVMNLPSCCPWSFLIALQTS